MSVPTSEERVVDWAGGNCQVTEMPCTISGAFVEFL